MIDTFVALERLFQGIRGSPLDTVSLEETARPIFYSTRTSSVKDRRVRCTVMLTW